MFDSLTNKLPVDYLNTNSPTTPHKRHKPSHPPTYSPGELGKLARLSARRLARLGWNRFYQQHYHHEYTSLSCTLDRLPHPAAPFLARLARHGVPALSHDPPWTLQQQDAAIRRGPHPSAHRLYASFLLEDMYDYVKMGYWLILPYTSIRGHPRLRIAPAGVVPQRERRPRPIMDYTFNSVNQQTVPLAPFSARQFGGSLQRVLQRLAYCNPAFGPPLLAKIDLADGYYRIPLSAATSLQLAVSLPSDGDNTPLIGLPLSLPMGWNLSPPYFCAFPETCADLTNSHPVTHTCHPFGNAAVPQITTPTQPEFAIDAILPFNPSPPETPLGYADVYMDDFLLAAQRPLHTKVMQTLLHHLSSMFADKDTSPRRLIVSASKVAKGDATFSTSKCILGWNVDTHRMTIHLPEHRLHRLQSVVENTLARPHTTRSRWRKLLGELRSTVPAIHSAKYLFSVLQHALTATTGRRIRLNAITKATLATWLQLFNSAHQTPVPITHLIPQAPHYYSAVDASSYGMGGFWVPTTLATHHQPIAWRFQWDPQVRNRLITSDNPHGTLTNSELELAALVSGHHAILQHTHQPHTSIVIATDNTPAKAWVKAGSVSTSKPPAFLLSLLAADGRAHNSHLTPVYTPGCTNTIADLLSRSFSLTDAALLDTLHSVAPMQPPWKLVTLPASWVSRMNWALLRQRPPAQSPPPPAEPSTPTGQCGPPSVEICAATPYCNTFKIPSPSCKFSLKDTAWETFLPPGLQSNLARWKEPYAPWVRRSPYWASATPDFNPLENSTYASIDNSRPTQKSTQHLLELNPSL